MKVWVPYGGVAKKRSGLKKRPDQGFAIVLIVSDLIIINCSTS